MLSYGDLKKGVIFVMDGQPWEVLESGFLRMQQRKAVMQTKLRSVTTGKIVDRNFQASDNFEEADIERGKALFIYTNKGEYWFNEPGNPKNRFALSAEMIGEGARFLKPNMEVGTLLFNSKIISVSLPVKMDFKVMEAPPSIKGNTAQGGVKQVILEGGAKVNVPLFINEGDTVRINTETGDYVERAEKG